MNSSEKDFLYTNSKYSDQFFSELRRLFIESKFTDVLLICSEKPSKETEEKSTTTIPVNSIPCHKLVLSTFSPYFQAMFSSNLIETKTNRVYMPNTDHKTLVEIINYAYCGSIYLNVSNVQNIFSLASLFQVKDILKACSDFMESELDLLNCVEIYQFAKQHMCDYLADKSKEFINKYFCDLVKSPEFLDIQDVELLEELLSSDELEVENEKIVLDSLVKWINFDIQNRIVYFERIFLKSIRYCLIEPLNLANFLEQNQLILNSSPKCQNILLNLSKSKNKDYINLNHKRRIGIAQECFLLIGGNCDLADGTYVNCFNPLNGHKFFLSKSFLDKVSLLNKGYFHIENPGACVTDKNRIFVAGGVYVFHKYNLPQKDLENSLSKNRSAQLESQNDENSTLRDGDETISKELYEYDSLQNTWIKRANMLFAKANFSLCTMNDRIYSFGGISIGQIPLDIVEYYDINENKWTYVGTMPTAFVAGCVVKYKDVFYVMGGRNGVGKHDTCYTFKPQSNEWTEISSLNIGRFNFGACVLNDKIYAFGGQTYAEAEMHFFTRKALDSVEVYDIKSNKWSFGAKMPMPLYNTGVGYYDEKFKSIYLSGTSESQYTGTTLFGYMFTSLFRMEFLDETGGQFKWTIVENDVSDIKAYYRCIAAKVNTKKLYKFDTQIEVRE